MPKNIFRAEALEKKRSGDSNENKPVGILRLPSKALLVFTISSALIGLAWAATAVIPLQKSGKAVVIDINNQISKSSGGGGRIVIKTKSYWGQYDDVYKLCWRIINEPRFSLNPDQIEEFTYKLLDMTDINRLTDAKDAFPTQIALDMISNHELFVRAGQPLAIVFDDQSRQSLIKSIRENTSDLDSGIAEEALNSTVRNRYGLIRDEQTKLVDIYNKLEKRRVVSQPDLINQKSSQAQYTSQVVQAESNLINAKNKQRTATRALMLALSEFISKTFVFAEVDGWIINLKVKQGNLIQPGEDFLVMERSKSIDGLPNIIAGLVDAATTNFVKVGNRVVATPSGIDKAEFGGMTGTIKTLIPFGETSESLSNIIGIQSLADQTSAALRNPNLVLIEMDKTIDDQYKWTTSRKPARLTRRGDLLDLSITTEGKTPLQLVIPWLKGVVGLEGPTTFNATNQS